MKISLFCTAVMLLLTNICPAQRPGPNLRLKEMLNQPDTVKLNHQLDSIRNSGKENDLQLLMDYYNAKNNEQAATGIKKTLHKKFPNGRWAFLEAAQRIQNENNTVENEKNYNELVKHFGKNTEFNLDPYGYFLAVNFLGKDQPDKVTGYLNKIKDPTYRTNAYSYVAREAIAAKDYKLGERLIRKTLSDIKYDTLHNGSDEFRRIFSELLFFNEKYDEGFPHAKMLYEKKPKTVTVKPAHLYNTYLNYLIKMKDYEKAYPDMLSLMKSGAAGALIKQSFKEAYVSVNASEVGLDQLLITIEKDRKAKIKDEVMKKMLNKKAVDFEVTNAKGEIVKLSDFAGKVVVLDFWATWCGPCKAAFPMMQTTMNNYKNDPNVKFLFIHTWERVNNPLKDALNYLNANGYKFDLYMDIKSATTSANPAAASFGIKGIPAKFIIDVNGNLRFAASGFTGGDDAAVEELSAMIDITKKIL